MAPPIAIAYRHFEPSAELAERIDDHVAELLKKHGDHVVDGRVTVEADNAGGDTAVLTIGVEMNIKGHTAVAHRTAHSPSPAGQRSVAKSVAEAFRAVGRQIKEHSAKMTGHQVKTLEHQRERGRVESLDRIDETGFIEMPNGLSLFFAKAVLKDTDFNALAEGDTVLVTEAAEDGPYGPQASSVELEVPEVRAR